MTHILFVANERVWPVRGGGPARMAGLVGALVDAGVGVTVAEPDGPATPSGGPAGVVRHSYPTPDPGRLWHSFGAAPRRGRAILGPGAKRVAALAERLGVDAVLFSHSYLGAVALNVKVPGIVDFPNLEVDRNRSLARVGSMLERASAALEAAKAARWEPRLARRVTAALGVTQADLTRLRSWGANAVLVPNAVARRTSTPSPERGPVVFVANAMYPPNRAAGQVLLGQVWPAVRQRWPAARLVVAGRGSREAFGAIADPTVEVRGEVDDVVPLWQAAAVAVSPVEAGAGTQLKIVEALGQGRLVVTSRYGLAGLPPGTDAAVEVADDPDAMADALVGVLADVEGRHRRERLLTERAAVPTWTEACAPLVSLLERLAM